MTISPEHLDGYERRNRAHSVARTGPRSPRPRKPRRPKLVPKLLLMWTRANLADRFDLMEQINNVLGRINRAEPRSSATPEWEQAVAAGNALAERISREGITRR